MYHSALIGKPTSLSVAPLMFQEMALQAGLVKSRSDYQHLRIDLETNELAPALQSFQALHFGGLNVTKPHKLAVIPLMNQLDETARTIGAVNVIKTAPDMLVGYNTDWQGVYEPIKRAHPTAPEAMTIFGNGGVARAAIYAAKRLGAKRINVLHRRKGEGVRAMQQQATELGVSMHDYSHAAEMIKGSSIIVNATSAGMGGDGSTPFDLRVLDSIDMGNKVFMDAVFNPLQTPSLSYFTKAGATTIDGLWMLIHQGTASLAIWFEQTAGYEYSPDQLQHTHDILVEQLNITK